MNTPNPSSPIEFVEFWSLRYSDPNERLYTANINCPHHNSGTLSALFKWKIGAWLFARALERTVKPKFLERIAEARTLPPDAEKFLNTFDDGGPIYRIFWLHCWHSRRFPVYDRHVHRAMVFIQDGRVEELSDFGEKEQISKYIASYIPFFQTFRDAETPVDLASDGIPGRRVDRALMAFGQAIMIPKQ